MGDHGRPTTPVDAHLARIVDAVQPLAPAVLPLSEALGLVAAADVVARLPLPAFDNSGMDGYAVHQRDCVGATAESPVHLPVVGGIGAGAAATEELAPGTAVKIMTGAPVPPGATAVVPYEWTDRGAHEVQVNQPPVPGQHIRRAGDDVEEGDLLVSAGTVLGPRHLGLLAGAGEGRVSVRPRPRVVIVSTGSELREPGQPLGPGQIHDANSTLLASSARAAGASAFRVGSVSDDPGTFLETLQDQISRADVIVTSGGVSQGDFDVVKAALKDRLWFGDVAMQPGKPQGFGTVDGVPVFTLPGNPVSAYLSFQLFVVPALRKLQGRSRLVHPLREARCSKGFGSPVGKRQFVRAAYDAGLAAPVGGHGSHLLGDLAAANALIVVPEETAEVSAGDTVQVLLLDEEY
ncbi:molybdotransferase-like divisome protein Glp [Nocardioides jiangxiensis]|uniref:Molybdopterin molybdenumtransferase n=1 Tax=Nocardioides jiangxiensis TaxID=3064524 RepID=A0ABT9B241_9ACTN|nr:gephyrin-like molybdotransferase Glp [Nocardioides sp. WY-20]MDO7867692.1 molybdopterin molybdotransferase MoeA [Nocardioides sp. WY-20]